MRICLLLTITQAVKFVDACVSNKALINETINVSLNYRDFPMCPFVFIC